MFVIVLLTTLATIVFYFIYQAWSDYRRIWKYAIHIPGPKGVPILGNAPETIRAYRVNGMRDLRMKFSLKYKSIHKMWALNKIMISVYNPEDVEMILTNMNLITKGEPYKVLHDWLGTGLLTSTDAKWQSRRKMITPAFHFSILQDFLNIFNRETENLVENLKKNCHHPIDITKPITEFALSSIGETSLGVQLNKEPNSQKYKNATYKFGEILMWSVLRPWFNLPILKFFNPMGKTTRETVGTLHDFSTKIIQKRKKQIETSGSYSMTKRMALLDLLLTVRHKEGINIDDEGIREEVDTFMFEGHDTTAVSLCYTLIILGNEQKAQEEIYQEIIDIMGKSKKHPDSKELADMTFMERCIKESLRLYPSVPTIMRYVTEDFTTKDGYVIPAGTNLDISIGEMHRMPNLWENPDKFDPDRFLPDNVAKRHTFAYIPFSAGPRNCIGQKYAIMELKTALVGILREFKLEPVTTYNDLVFKLDMVLRPAKPLKIKFVSRMK